MYIREAVDEVFAPMGVYEIYFGEDGEDKTEFFVENFGDLKELWDDFCAENDFDPDNVFEVCLKCDAQTILEAYLDKHQAELQYSAGWGWTVVYQTEDPDEELAGDEVYYKRWEDMIYDMSVELGW